MGNTQVSDVIREIDQLIKDNHLMVFHKSNTAACIDSLWKNLDTDQKKQAFVINLRMYCDLKNSFEGNEKCQDKMKLVIRDLSGNAQETIHFDGKKFEYLKLQA